MENLYDNVLSMKKIKLAPEQMLVENNIQTESSAEVAKILATDSSVVLDPSVEALSGEASVSGKVVLNVVYLTTEGELLNQNAVSPFTHKIKDENIDPSCKFNIFSDIAGSEISRVSNNQIKVITTLNFDTVVIKNQEIKFLIDGGENTQTKKYEQNITSHDKQICETFEETLSATVKNGVKKILMTNVDCIVKDWTAGLGFAVVELDVYARVLFADLNDPSELQTIAISKSVKQEIEVQGLNKDSDIDVSSFIVKDGIQVELNDAEDTIISVNVPIMVCLNSYSCNSIMAVNDMFSTKNIIEIANESFENDKNNKPEYLEGKIEGNVVLSEQTPRVDKYICTTNVKAQYSNCYVKGDSLIIEGIVTANVVYLNDELGEMQSVEIEIPYVLDKNVDYTEDVLLEPTIFVTDVDVMVKRGRELFFDAKARAFVNCTKKDVFSHITNVDTIGEIGERDGAVELYFAKQNETIWDIAKNLKISPNVITEQNPELLDPIEKDQSIAVYFQKKR